MFYAYDYLKGKKAMLEDDYPYTAMDEDCKYDATKEGIRITGHVMITPNDPNELLKAVALHPTAIGVEAGQAAF